MKELTIVTHLGLGDLILQSGLAVHLTKEYDKVYYPCCQKDFNSVRSFFLLQPKVEVVPIDTESPHPEHRGIKQGSEALLLGFYSPTSMDKGISFAENFYRQAGVDYSVRWDLCPIQEVVNVFYDAKIICGYGYLIHEDKNRGFLTKCPVVESDTYVIPSSASMLAYASAVKYAQQIHVIDGPFLHLAESIETHGDLYYHRYARPLSARWNDIDCPSRKKWIIHYAL